MEGCFNIDCDEEFKIGWDNLGEIITCKCGKKHEVCYEENMDCDYYFYLEEIVEG